MDTETKCSVLLPPTQFMISHHIYIDLRTALKAFFYSLKKKTEFSKNAKNLQPGWLHLKLSCFFSSYIADDMNETDALASLLPVIYRGSEHLPWKKYMTNYITTVNFWYETDYVNKNRWIRTNPHYTKKRKLNIGKFSYSFTIGK